MSNHIKRFVLIAAATFVGLVMGEIGYGISIVSGTDLKMAVSIINAAVLGSYMAIEEEYGEVWSLQISPENLLYLLLPFAAVTYIAFQLLVGGGSVNVRSIGLLLGLLTLTALITLIRVRLLTDK